MFTSEYHETITLKFRHNKKATYYVASVKAHTGMYELIHYDGVVEPHNKLTELIPHDLVEQITLQGYGHPLSHYKKILTQGINNESQTC